MNIMHFAGGGDIGGAKTHIFSLGKQLSQENAFHLVSFRPGPFAEEARELGLEVTVAEHPWNLSSSLRTALKAVDRFKPDVIHCHGAKANMMGVLVKHLRKIPIVTTVHSDPARDYMGNPLKQGIFGSINMLALRQMDFYMAVAGRMESSLIQRGIDPQKIFVIHNGLDFSKAAPAPRQLRPEDEVVVGIAARLTPIKDIPTLLRAFAKAHARNPRLRLKIAGIGEDENSLRALARQLGVEERVDFVGWITDMQSFFSGVDINVLSSFSETFPYSLLEGACQRCAAIASAVGGIPELITHGESGFLFQPQDVDAFAEYIYQMSTDEDLRHRMAEGLFQVASSRYSLEHMRKTQQTAYERLLKRTAGKKERQGAVICGAYGRGNAGDEGILQAIVAQMRGIDAEIPLTVLSRNKLETRLKNKTDSIYIFNIPAFIKKLRKAKLFINGGGSLIQDVTSSRSLYFYLFTLWAARICGCRVIMYGCGIGPIKKKHNRQLAAKVLDKNVEIITLRDSKSLSVVKAMGVERPKVLLAADPTVNFAPAPVQRVEELLRELDLQPEQPMIGFCLRNWPGFDHPEYFAEAAEYAYERYGLIPVFLPIELPKDQEAAARVTALLKVPHRISSRRYPASELIGLLGSMKLVVGMRLHSLIFASTAGTPVIGVSYDVKVDSFIHDIGSEACIPLGSFSKEELLRQIDLQAEQGFMQAPQAMQRLREGERINTDSARSLLGK
ncbi:MAG: polysaccharide pyruvyl transferase CsaB [Bacillota bacterium]|nr:polysaccharide pyruvyl transferase CsaB [Bacillota bacterium]